MPSLSTTVAKVLQVCNSPSASPNDLNRVISLDPVLTGQVLKLINSAYYGLPSRITSLPRAIIMLGINTVKNLVLATSVLGSFKNSMGMRQLSIDAFWAHSLCVGVTAKALAQIQQVPVIEQEEFFVAGLLHDLGKLPMMACFPDVYEATIEQADEEQRPLFGAERQRIGFNHCQVGRMIAAHWKLNGNIGNAIIFHHQPLDAQSEKSRLLYSLSLANQAAHRFQIVAGEPACSLCEDETLLPALCEKSGLDPDTVFALQPEIERQIENAKVFLHVAGKG